MATVGMEELVSVYNSVLEFDNPSEDIRIYIFKNKEDLIKKYVEKNLLQMKVDEPNSNQKYEDKYKKYLEEIRMLCTTFTNNEIIVVGVFGKNTDRIDINKNTVHLYHLEEIDLLSEDVKEYYKD